MHKCTRITDIIRQTMCKFNSQQHCRFFSLNLVSTMQFECTRLSDHQRRATFPVNKQDRTSHIIITTGFYSQCVFAALSNVTNHRPICIFMSAVANQRRLSQNSLTIGELCKRVNRLTITYRLKIRD